MNITLLFDLEGNGQTDSVPGICNHGFVPLGTSQYENKTKR